ncbi:hypothetical protein FVF58_35665 [Paraburkholderia panacisoli]|uniref:Uncharacterized protein n=1 Tax=Paraburkholderia panacisoli TaxID=2603818 RepID=A0A5B0GL89_9BURK|nr:hypothetical protein FVF58_35665 [Paraburkholderia panacisoli]
MKMQTFAQKLWLPLLSNLVCLTAIKGFDVWLLHQAHRTNRASIPGRDRAFEGGPDTHFKMLRADILICPLGKVQHARRRNCRDATEPVGP